MFMKILPQMCLQIRRSPLNFGSHPNPDTGSPDLDQTSLGGGLHSPSVLVITIIIILLPISTMHVAMNTEAEQKVICCRPCARKLLLLYTDIIKYAYGGSG